jgi:thymidylate synthase ThyX
MINAKIVADSITATGDRLTTLEVIMPRYILAEFNTHRMLSKNSASSRAIPLRKMLLEAIHRPFIPYAFQKDHKGMQGTEYFSKHDLFSLADFMDKAKEFIIGTANDESLDLYIEIMGKYKHKVLTLEDWWLLARDKAVEMVAISGIFGVTKQLANRLLEPFMYHKVLVSGTEWENFFNLRCPSYTFHNDNSDKDFVFKSRKEAIRILGKDNPVEYKGYAKRLEDLSLLEWLDVNTGQADIHMMFLAEAIYDAIKESIPKELKEGEWHIPYGNNMSIQTIDNWLIITNYGKTDTRVSLQCKIAIARCARLSYQTLGDNPVINYEKDLSLYESLSTSRHWSPFEHVAKAMTENEHNEYIKGKFNYTLNDFKETSKGWCRNYRGFIQYRELLDK